MAFIHFKRAYVDVNICIISGLFTVMNFFVILVNELPYD